MRRLLAAAAIGAIVGTGILLAALRWFDPGTAEPPAKSAQLSGEPLVRGSCTDYIQPPALVLPVAVYGTDPATGERLIAFRSDGTGCVQHYIYQRPLVVQRPDLPAEPFEVGGKEWIRAAASTSAMAAQVEHWPLPEALAVLSAGGWEQIRLIDGYGEAITMDWQLTRIDLVVVDGVVRESFPF